MGSDLTVGIAGATGALGKEIVAVLDRAPWRPARIVPLASAATTVSFVEWGDGKVAVDDLADADLGELDLLFLAAPPAVSAEVGRRALADDVPVVDCTGAFADDPDVPVVIPWINPEALGDPPLAVRVPTAAAALIASVLGPLARASAVGPARATVLLPASHWGRDGIDELSRQVVALFNSGTPPRKVFPGGLAFDLLPVVGALEPDGWSVDEKRAAADAIAISGWPAELHLTLVGVPVFSGVSAEVALRPERRVPPELAEQILVDGGMRRSEGEGARAVPRPRRVEGQPFPHVGRVRGDDGGTLSVWAVGDNLRMCATAAVAAAGVLARAHRGRGDG